MNQYAEEFSIEYKKFLKNVKKALRRRLTDDDDALTNQLVTKVFKGLKSDEGIHAVSHAANQVDRVTEIIDGPNAQYAMVTELLTLELKIYNQRYGDETDATEGHSISELQSQPRPPQAPDDQQSQEHKDKDLHHAATIKESIHKLLSDQLPAWVSKLFDILNELLKLV